MKEDLLAERLKRCEALLQEKGIDLNQITGTIDTERHEPNGRSQVPEADLQLPTPATTVSEPQSTSFRPKLLHGQRGTELVDK